MKPYCNFSLIISIDTLPVVIACICYFKIWKVVFRSKKTVNKGNATKDKSIYRTLIITLIAMLVTCMPIGLSIMAESWHIWDVNLYLYRLASYMLVSGSFLNPLIFAVFNRQFREAYLELFSKFLKRQSTVWPVSTGVQRTNLQQAILPLQAVSVEAEKPKKA